MKSSITVEKVARYVVEEITTESALERKLRSETEKLSEHRMISSSDVGALLAILAQSVNARKALEIGTFTGYTALKVATVLPPNGKLICCDISREWTDIGRPFWKEAGVSDRIDLHIAPALDTLSALIKAGESASYDFAFIDADKTGYDSYYEACLTLIRPGGLIVLDNMLWNGAVTDANSQDANTMALQTLNKKISQDSRVNSCLLTVGDGLMLARKK
ncbi:MAG: SAM-dependent methyltransferase [Bdellovibrio sp. CG10_big_fil_rev_8_21_14_0_10_47_8]|nr:MAG: SAM-dependent methyltransferase [Bdellovibrio sp. CG10_big_fil_rev_8_21_14_0_10_47_8]